MGNEGIFKGVAGECRYGQGGRCLKKFDDPCFRVFHMVLLASQKHTNFVHNLTDNPQKYLFTINAAEV